MAALGTLAARIDWRTLRKTMYTPEYLADRAFFPVRLNGTPAHFYAGASSRDGPPWSSTPQPLSDVNGRILYHRHSIPLLWTAGAGARSLSIDVWHNFAAGAMPRLRLAAITPLGIAEQIATATATPNTKQTLTVAATLATKLTLIFFLECDNPDHGGSTTWGNIATA